ncbi:MAG: hypothetical protein LBC68_14860 [Prevotellaceae bacterium]|jgi:hypothetical protein|nr:hypothetical protein [Prevotellaceae bacterium]
MKPKLFILTMVCAGMFFYSCTTCKPLQQLNLPQLDWNEYHSVEIISPYACYSNDTNILHQEVKVYGWIIRKISSFFLYNDDPSKTDTSIYIEVWPLSTETKNLLNSMEDGIADDGVAKKCYIVGKLGCSADFTPTMFYEPCPTYVSVLEVENIDNISFENEGGENEN